MYQVINSQMYSCIRWIKQGLKLEMISRFLQIEFVKGSMGIYRLFPILWLVFHITNVTWHVQWQQQLKPLNMLLYPSQVFIMVFHLVWLDLAWSSCYFWNHACCLAKIGLLFRASKRKPSYVLLNLMENFSKIACWFVGSHKVCLMLQQRNDVFWVISGKPLKVCFYRQSTRTASFVDLVRVMFELRCMRP